MSIVDRALRKAKDSGQPPPSNQVFGTVIEAPIPYRAPPQVAPVSPPPVVPSRMVSINQTALRAAGLLPPEHQERQISSQYRQIKRPLIADAVGRGKPRLPNGQLIMVASAMPGEGKTFTSINLAFSMALEKDIHVLLVDADVAKPQVSKLFGIVEEPGLLDALVDPGADLESFILATDVPNLSVLPAGKRTDQATELLTSDRMTEVTRALASRDPTRIVIFDSPPILLTTESQALAHVVGQIVVVVRAGHTQQQVVLDALSYLPEGSNISLILNQSLTRGDYGSYYYGYGADPRQPAE